MLHYIIKVSLQIVSYILLLDDKIDTLFSVSYKLLTFYYSRESVRNNYLMLSDAVKNKNFYRLSNACSGILIIYHFNFAREKIILANCF